MGWLNGRTKDDGRDSRPNGMPEADVFNTPAPVAPVVTSAITPSSTNGIAFKKAVKYASKGRIALIGPAGSGKSYTSLLLARALAGPNGRIAAIDTEHGSLSKYADLFDFDVIELDSFSPQTYVEALHAAENAGYDVFLCDSLSHFWTGRDGALEFVDMAGKRSKDNMGGWKEFRPHERLMVDEMISSPCHVICTMRTKTAYEEQIDEKGKKKRVKIGLAPVQRDGLEYEFDLVGYMEEDNTFITDKTRCPFYAQKAYTKPGPKEFAPLVEWLKGGAVRGPVVARKIDTGGNPTNTVAAAQHVAAQKIAAGNPDSSAVLQAPWKSLVEAEQCFHAIRERVGEVIWRERLETYGWREPVDIRNAMGSRDTETKTLARKNARELYWALDAIVRREVM
jgi:energy-coupling factor transporter ATP-binding protein EcfA2